MKITLASHLGMCFGVRDAIKLAHETAARQPLTILGDLVHNPGVLQDLESRGIHSKKNPADVSSGVVMITAHGASQRLRAQLDNANLTVKDATCPLVKLAHHHLSLLVKRGYYPIIIGKAAHVEVRGMTDDLDQFTVILSADDICDIPERPRYGIVAQTTQPIQRVRQLVHQISRRFPTSEIEFRDTVCQPTKDRQLAAKDLAMKSDVVVVIGGPHSNNTKALLSLCRSLCARVHHVQSSRDLRPHWFQQDDQIGITAGTSTPPTQIDAVVQQLHQWIPANKELSNH